MDQIKCGNCSAVLALRKHFLDSWDGAGCQVCKTFYCPDCYKTQWCCGDKLDLDRDDKGEAVFQ